MHPERRVGFTLSFDRNYQTERAPRASELEKAVALAVAVDLRGHFARAVARFLRERFPRAGDGGSGEHFARGRVVPAGDERSDPVRSASEGMRSREVRRELEVLDERVRLRRQGDEDVELSLLAGEVRGTAQGVLRLARPLPRAGSELARQP